MGKYYRYRLPPWARQCIFVIEKSILPILIFQAIRTLLFPTSLDVLLLVLLIGLFIAFYLNWL